jgi:hypothetical protein
MECYRCHDFGHFQWECSKRAKEHTAKYIEQKKKCY